MVINRRHAQTNVYISFQRLAGMKNSLRWRVRKYRSLIILGGMSGPQGVITNSSASRGRIESFVCVGLCVSRERSGRAANSFFWKGSRE